MTDQPAPKALRLNMSIIATCKCESCVTITDWQRELELIKRLKEKVNELNAEVDELNRKHCALPTKDSLAFYTSSSEKE
jgi:chorismate mutase